MECVVDLCEAAPQKQKQRQRQRGARRAGREAPVRTSASARRHPAPPPPLKKSAPPPPAVAADSAARASSAWRRAASASRAASARAESAAGLGCTSGEAPRLLESVAPTSLGMASEARREVSGASGAARRAYLCVWRLDVCVQVCWAALEEAAGDPEALCAPVPSVGGAIMPSAEATSRVSAEVSCVVTMGVCFRVLGLLCS